MHIPQARLDSTGSPHISLSLCRQTATNLQNSIIKQLSTSISKRPFEPIPTSSLRLKKINLYRNDRIDQEEHHGDGDSGPAALRTREADPRAQSAQLLLQLHAVPARDIRPRVPAEPTSMQSLRRGPLPFGLVVPRPARSAERGEQHERELQLFSLQALAACALQKGRELRVLARVQLAQDA